MAPPTADNTPEYVEALKRIEECLDAKRLGLDLSDLGLSTLPPEIGRLADLKTLHLGGNQLSTLPPEIGRLADLTTLFLGGNRLSTLPPEIFLLIRLTTLDLSGNSLATLPPEIGRLTRLTTLDLSGNRLGTLPPEIGRLTHLTRLSITGNRLATLPSEIGRLTDLTTLFLHDNQLSTLPPEIGQLAHLTTLALGDNQFSALPPEIGRLTDLKTLHLGGNQLATLPPEIGQLANLTTLLLSGNRLASLPSEIGSLTDLTRLSLGGNRLAALQPEIRRLTHLMTLHLGGNQIAALPPEIGRLVALMILDLTGNKLSTLPPEIARLTALTELYIHDNAGLAIPASILGPTFIEVHGRDKKTAASPQDILNFYFAQREAADSGTLRPVNEIKVMLVGRGGAGKTSLRRFFLGEPHDVTEKETPGIALDNFQLRCEKGAITVRLWDFAGQEITHALHQFFLTEGCVYVLVLDPRSNTEMQDAEYWLGLLSRYAGGSQVLVALNRQDARQGGYDIDRRVLKERFPFIQSFTRTNCANRENCAELRQQLCESVEVLKDTEPPHLKVPEMWLKVLEACAGEPGEEPKATGNRLLRWLGLAGQVTPSGKQRQHLTLEEFRQICAKSGEMEPSKQESLARLLHKLGAVLHFVDEPRLRDTTVLDPHWVTDGVYRLLRFKDRPASDGTLTLAEALQALPGETEETARFLLRLMERFEMCFPLDEEDGGKEATKWLIPGALGEFQPPGVTQDWQNSGGVRLRYVYDPLPEGVLPRFIVLTHSLSEGKPRWRNGVVLQEENAVALVRRGENRNHVEVTAFGPDANRLRLLEIIQGNLDRIHADLPDPKPFAELELDGLPRTFRRVADLEAAELGKQQLPIDTKQGPALVEPTRQLNRTSEPESRSEARIPLHAFLSYAHEDKRAKAIFQQNMTVLTKKKLITPWHDGLIDPGMRWREEIEENLGRMDVFVGLLTTAFLASDFIERVEIKTARKKLQEEGKEFLFVLILVDDISLAELDLAEYQIMKPGGRAVCQHPSRKAGFNQAQKELEQLILSRQEVKKKEMRNRPVFHQPSTRGQEQAGVRIINVHGIYVEGDMPMKDDHSQHFHGKVINSQVGQTLTNCSNMVQQQAPGERKSLLEVLEIQVQQILNALPADKHEEAAGNLELAVKAATSAKPNRAWYSVSAEGLLEASKWVKDFGGNIGATLWNLGKSLWPDFKLPESK